MLRLEAPPSQYAAFCRANPGVCILTGAEVLAASPDALARLASVNRAVKR